MSAAIADRVLDANYEGPHAADAKYFAPGLDPAGEAGVPVRVMQGGREGGLDLSGLNARPVADAAILKVRVKQLAEIRTGAHFRLEFTGDVYRVQGEPSREDRARREWTCDCILAGRGA